MCDIKRREQEIKRLREEMERKLKQEVELEYKEQGKVEYTGYVTIEDLIIAGMYEKSREIRDNRVIEKGRIKRLEEIEQEVKETGIGKEELEGLKEIESSLVGKIEALMREEIDIEGIVESKDFKKYIVKQAKIQRELMREEILGELKEQGRYTEKLGLGYYIERDKETGLIRGYRGIEGYIEERLVPIEDIIEMVEEKETTVGIEQYKRYKEYKERKLRVVEDKMPANVKDTRVYGVNREDALN